MESGDTKEVDRDGIMMGKKGSDQHEAERGQGGLTMKLYLSVGGIGSQSQSDSGGEESVVKRRVMRRRWGTKSVLITFFPTLDWRISDGHLVRACTLTNPPPLIPLKDGLCALICLNPELQRYPPKTSDGTMYSKGYQPRHRATLPCISEPPN